MEYRGIEKNWNDLILTFGPNQGKQIKATSNKYQKSLRDDRIDRDFLLWFDILHTPEEALITDWVLFDYSDTYEEPILIGTLRGFVIGDPIVEIYNGDITLLRRNGWIDLEIRDILVKVKKGVITKVKNNTNG